MTQRRIHSAARVIATALAIAVVGSFWAPPSPAQNSKTAYPRTPAAPASQTADDVARKSAGCLSCHEATESQTMHPNAAVALGCTDCHGGGAGVVLKSKLPPSAPAYVAARDHAHVLPRFPQEWHFPRSANPQRSYTL